MDKIGSLEIGHSRTVISFMPFTGYTKETERIQ